MFRVGQIVYHKNDGERVRIKHLNEAVALCEEIDKGLIEINIRGVPMYPTRVSLLENLTFTNEKAADPKTRPGINRSDQTGRKSRKQVIQQYGRNYPLFEP